MTFFFIYIKSLKVRQLNIPQKTRKCFIKSSQKDQNLSEEEKAESDNMNMVENDIRISQKMKNKN